MKPAIAGNDLPVSHLQISPLPLGVRLLSVWTLTTGGELQELRSALHRTLAAHRPKLSPESDETVEHMLLVATELATNAIRHGLPPTEVRLLRAEDQFILDVADNDERTAPQPAFDRPTGDGGLGLRLALSFSLRVGWYTDDGSKHIWASFPAAAG